LQKVRKIALSINTMSIQLICSDIDGTLLNKDRELSELTKEQVLRLSYIPFILISSRMPKAMVHLQNEFGNAHLPIIAYNGGLIIDKGEIIDTTEIENSITVSLHRLISKTSLHISLYHNDEWFVPEMDFWAQRESNNTKVIPEVQPVEKTLLNWNSENKGAHKIMLMGDALELDSVVSFISAHFDEALVGYRSKETYLEIAHKSISKKTAIETLLSSHYPKLSLEDVLAFGDNYNDIEMLKAAGIGVAVENSKAAVLKIADAVTDTNKNDGVAKYLIKHF
jgi:Cof subfamily protein (haloacid dehalogenase superfamily)